jgi:hypothetical protein
MPLFRTTPTTTRSFYGDAVFLAFLIAQAVDGAFTYVGVGTFGHSIEANPVVAWYIAVFGAGVALIATKALAVACAAILHLYAMHQTIGALTLFYIAVAILPWARLFIG